MSTLFILCGYCGCRCANKTSHVWLKASDFRNAETWNLYFIAKSVIDLSVGLASSRNILPGIRCFHRRANLDIPNWTW